MSDIRNGQWVRLPSYEIGFVVGSSTSGLTVQTTAGKIETVPAKDLEAIPEPTAPEPVPEPPPARWAMPEVPKQ
jgi:hypothetical protein